MDLLLSVLLFCFVIFLRFLSANSRDSSPLAPALYVFGDSLFNSGNNNLLPTLAKANYLPYGVNFPGGVTGRFTNGRTVADFIAEYLGLPYPPPSIRVHGTVVTGLNYASGSCGILKETGNHLGKCLNLDEQIELFKLTVERKLAKEYGSEEEVSAYLSKSIFVFSVGNNDYINNYLQPHQYHSSRRYTPQQFAQLLVDKLSLALQNLYNLGARKVVVFELGPIGCIPSIIKKSRNSEKCVEETNTVVSYFNNGVGAAMLKNLASTLSGSAFIFGKVNWLAYDAIMNPSKYGLKETRNPCCTSWLNGSLSCIPFMEPCPNRSEYFFWDAFHTTEAACSMVAARCITGSSVCVPMNIKALVQI